MNEVSTHLFNKTLLLAAIFEWGNLRRDVGMKSRFNSHNPSMRTWHPQFPASMTEGSTARPMQESQFL